MKFKELIKLFGLILACASYGEAETSPNFNVVVGRLFENGNYVFAQNYLELIRHMNKDLPASELIRLNLMSSLASGHSNNFIKAYQYLETAKKLLENLSNLQNNAADKKRFNRIKNSIELVSYDLRTLEAQL